MFAIDEAKLPPPNPHSSAMIANSQNVVPGSWTASPIQMAGIASDAVEMTVQRRPPRIGTMKL